MNLLHKLYTQFLISRYINADPGSTKVIEAGITILIVDIKKSLMYFFFGVTSDSKKPGQTTVVIQYCSLSRFF